MKHSVLIPDTLEGVDSLSVILKSFISSLFFVEAIFDMVDVWLPYGKTEVCVRVPARNLLGVISPNPQSPVSDSMEELNRAINEPVDERSLSDLVKPSVSVAIIVDLETRFDVNRALVLSLINKLNELGVSNESLTIILGYSLYEDRDVTRIADLFKTAFKTVKIVIHDPTSNDLLFLGKTQNGTPVYFNQHVAAADIKILTGDLRFTSRLGCDKLANLLLSVSGDQTIQEHHNHSSDFHLDSFSEENPNYSNILDIGNLGKITFALNIVTSLEGKIVKAFAGNFKQVFAEGTKLAKDLYHLSIDKRADIVVVSPGGHPLDSDLYTAYKSVESALRIVKRGGIIILIAECSKGYGDQVFYDWSVKFNNHKNMTKHLKRRFKVEGFAAFCLKRALHKAKLFLVSIMPDYYAVNIFQLQTARAANDALSNAFNLVGTKAKVWAISHGNSIDLTFKEK